MREMNSDIINFGKLVINEVKTTTINAAKNIDAKSLTKENYLTQIIGITQIPRKPNSDKSVIEID